MHNTTYTLSCSATNNVSSVTKASIRVISSDNSVNKELYRNIFDADGKDIALHLQLMMIIILYIYMLGLWELNKE